MSYFLCSCTIFIVLAIILIKLRLMNVRFGQQPVSQPSVQYQKVNDLTHLLEDWSSKRWLQEDEMTETAIFRRGGGGM